MNCKLVIALVFTWSFSLTAQAKLFKNDYLSFELPENWVCKQEGSEWLCTNPLEVKLKEAIIVLTAKEQSPADNLDSYEAYLKTEKFLPSKKSSGKPKKSKMVNVSRRKIGGQVWVDGMHVGSEVNSFYTRYLATVKNKLAILITFSAHKQHYTKYARAFVRGAQTLNISVSPNLLKRPSGSSSIGSRGGDLMNLNNLPSEMAQIEDLPSEDETTGFFGGENSGLLGGALLIATISGFLLLRRKKKKKRY